MYKIICTMIGVLILVSVYAVIAQSPGAAPYKQPGGIPVEIEALKQYCADLKDYCLDSAYERKEEMESRITYYNAVPYTHVQLQDGNYVPIADWLPTVVAALADVEADIATLESH